MIRGHSPVTAALLLALYIVAPQAIAAHIRIDVSGEIVTSDTTRLGALNLSAGSLVGQPVTIWFRLDTSIAPANSCPGVTGNACYLGPLALRWVEAGFEVLGYSRSSLLSASPIHGGQSVLVEDAELGGSSGDRLQLTRNVQDQFRQVFVGAQVRDDATNFVDGIGVPTSGNWSFSSALPEGYLGGGVVWISSENPILGAGFDEYVFFGFEPRSLVVAVVPLPDSFALLLTQSVVLAAYGVHRHSKHGHRRRSSSALAHIARRILRQSHHLLCTNTPRTWSCQSS